MCSVWPTIDTLLINHDETLWAVSVHARPPVVPPLFFSRVAQPLTTITYRFTFTLSSLSLSDYYFANHPKCPFLSLLAPALRSISIQKGVSDHPPLAVPPRPREKREEPFEASNEKEYFFFFFFPSQSFTASSNGWISNVNDAMSSWRVWRD